jgi:signal peptidase I
VDLVQSYLDWRSHSRALKEARLLLREGRRVLRKHADRLTPKQTVEVRDAVDKLDGAVEGRDWDKLSSAIATLDKRLDDYLAFARKSTTREYFESIAVAVLIALFLRAFVVEAFKIPSGSMIPTLQVGDHIFVNKFIYGVRVPWTNIKFGMNYRTPRRGEVIVFKYPKEPDKDFIKRIVAVAGDTVEVRDNSTIYVNDKPVVRKHIDGPCEYEDYREEIGRWETGHCDAWQEQVNGHPYTTINDKFSIVKSSPRQVVPPDSVFVMGDNRDNSHDSRFWGFVPYDHIKGKAMIIWFSIGKQSPDDPPFIRFFKAIRYGRMLGFVR